MIENSQGIIDWEDFEEALKAAQIPEEEMRTHWIPLLDQTGLVVAVAWINDEKTAWQLFEYKEYEMGHA